MVDFVMSGPQRGQRQERVVLRPERSLQTAHVGSWLVLATLLWSIVAIPALVL